MKFSCTQENLSCGVNLAEHVASRGGNLPILSNILIQCQPEGIYISATNLELGIRCLVRGKVEEAGEFTIPAKVFSEYINLLSDKVDVGLKEQALEISSGATTSKLKGLPASEFPLLPKIEGGERIVCDKEEFARAVAKVVFAASQTETRPELAGVFLKVDPKEKTAVLAATDSYRLAEYKLPVSEAPMKEMSIIVPGRTLQSLARVFAALKGEEKDLKIEVGNNQISFFYNNVELVSRLVDGAYPDYTQIIPKEFKTKMKVNRGALIKAVKAASLFARSGIYDVTLQSAPQEGLKVGSSNTQLGEHTTNIETEINGEGCAVVFNFHYLLDGLQAIGTEEVSIELIDSNHPCLFTASGKDTYLYIVMPIRQ